MEDSKVTPENVEQAIKEAMTEAIEKHRKMGVPAAFSRDGKVYLLMPDGSEVLAPIK